MQEHLRIRPQLAMAVLLPVSGRRWIAVESISHKKVAELCKNLSTIRHPLEIELVPVEDRVAWLNWQPTMLHLLSWVQIKRGSIMKRLDASEKDLSKYAGDLALVMQMKDRSEAAICLVPRLPVTIGSGAKNRWTKLLPRLLHPRAIGAQVETIDITMDLNVWWWPNRPHELETSEYGICRLAKVKNSDQILLPFVAYRVSVELLQTTDVTPTLSELRLFTEGIVVGRAELDFEQTVVRLRYRNPCKEFMRWTYENHIAAPPKQGHKVEVQSDMGMLRGVVQDIKFEDLDVRLDDTQAVISIDAKCARRYYEVGDAVKVIKCSHHDREGWVLDIKEDVVEVFDRNTKDAVCTRYMGTTCINTETVSCEILATTPIRRV